jgi:hypothetical protein
MDIADEIVLATADAEGRLSVIKRIDPFEHVEGKLQSRDSAPPSKVSPRRGEREIGSLLRGDWVLLLNQNESVTPFLAKELQQRIVDGTASAFRIPLEPHYFGQPVAIRGSQDNRPVRLLRQADCSLTACATSFSIDTRAHNVGELSGTVEQSACASVAEFVERLNEKTSQAALSRYRAGERARFARATWRAGRRFLGAWSALRGFRSGPTGLQIAALEGFFAWVEEAKLRQISHQFRVADDGPSANLDDHHSHAHTPLPPPRIADAA